MKQKYIINQEKKWKKLIFQNIFGLEFNNDLVSQVLYIQRSNRRAGTAHTKDRSEVKGANQKPWQQKGTGRARHGSKRSPIWVEGVWPMVQTRKRIIKKIFQKLWEYKLYLIFFCKIKRWKNLICRRNQIREF